MAQKSDRYSNPPFDDRIYSLSGLESTAKGTGVSTGDLQRGYMIQDKGLGKIRYSTRFLYNPSVVVVSHSTDVANSSSLVPQNYRNPLDIGRPNLPLMATVTFNLLFDRTYELWNAGAENPNKLDFTTSPSKAGVRVDVDSLYRVVGIYQPVATPLPNTNPDNTPATLFSNGSPGPMPVTPLTVYFGGENSLSYHGFVTSLDVQWTHFSQLMVPMRCTVGVSMSLMTTKTWTSEWDEDDEDGSSTKKKKKKKEDSEDEFLGWQGTT